MQTNSMLEQARETRKKIRKVFMDKVDTIAAYDIVEQIHIDLGKECILG